MYIPEFWVGFGAGAIVMFIVLFGIGLFIMMVNDRNERVAAEK